MKKIVIDGVEYAPVGAKAENAAGLPYVIVRCYAAGVHAGYLKRRDDVNKVVDLVSARRLWQWHGRTLSGLAVEGTDDPSLCRFGDPLDIVLAEWCEIMPCTEAARDSLESVKEWKND